MTFFDLFDRYVEEARKPDYPKYTFEEKIKFVMKPGSVTRMDTVFPPKILGKDLSCRSTRLSRKMASEHGSEILESHFIKDISVNLANKGKESHFIITIACEAFESSADSLDYSFIGYHDISGRDAAFYCNHLARLGYAHEFFNANPVNIRIKYPYKSARM